MRYTITRADGRPTTTCDQCGDTSGPVANDRATEVWQRAHTTHHATPTHATARHRRDEKRGAVPSTHPPLRGR